MQYLPLIWIVVPVFEREDCVINLVEQLRKQTYNNYNLIIIDHGKKKIKKIPDQNITIITASSKLWWSGAVNKGINYILENKNISLETPILVINDDVIIGNDYLSNLILDWKNDKTTMIGSLCVESNSSNIIYANIVLNKMLAKFEYANTSCKIEDLKDKLLPSDLLSGRGTLIPANIFIDIGLYDEINLPHYRADYELVYRAKKRGYHAFVSGNSIVYTELNVPGKLNKNNLLPSICSVFFQRKSSSNLKDLFNYSYLNFGLIYGTYFFIVNSLRSIGYVLLNS
ncbi:glycosyltransferase family 2 protein [Methanolobus vulcani]|uniref:Glycosyltransferase family 2 protein n=1 Tax=Methanolobus vulcani TaxID=38026 RepID=A0A7Z8KLV7_9EURY|nr:glycosyltransferase [Methanolobus vulcani]TQD23859.1 glycosyltransferase family 2 protein [Methanolobus vulcani]